MVVTHAGLGIQGSGDLHVALVILPYGRFWPVVAVPGLGRIDISYDIEWQVTARIRSYSELLYLASLTGTSRPELAIRYTSGNGENVLQPDSKIFWVSAVSDSLATVFYSASS
jgi:hypothetical protein